MLCNYKFIQSIPNFPKRTYKPAKPITRQDVREKATEEKNKEKSSKDNINEEKNSKAESQKSNTNKKASCKDLPPGEQRLRPEGKSPPLHSSEQQQGSRQQLPSTPSQGQPTDNNRAGKSVKTTMGHAMATAASLLKKPARKSDYV